MAIDTIDAFRSTNYEIAEAIAPTWERRRADIERSSAPVREWMLRALATRPGETVLELAAATGDTGFEAVARAGDRGRLITTDFSPSMLASARRRGAALGVDNVEYRVMDAQRIELDADSVDGVLCRFGYMLMPDPAAALSEARRVLRPGGRLALAVWGAPDRNPFFGVISTSLVRRGHHPPPEPPPAPGIFSMASVERTTALLQAAGFGAVRAEEVPLRFEVPDAEEHLCLLADTAGPVGLALQRLTDAERAAVKADLEDALLRFTVGEGFELPGAALCAVAS